MLWDRCLPLSVLSLLAHLVPCFRQQKVSDILVFDTIPAHIKFVHRDNILGEVIADRLIGAEFPGNCLGRREQIANLDIELFVGSLRDEVDFLLAGLTDCDIVAATDQLDADNVFKELINITIVSAIDCLPNAMIHQIVLLIDRQDALADKILAAQLAKEKSVTTGPDVVEDCFGSNPAIFTLEVVGNAPCAEGVPDIGHDVGDYSLEKIDIANLISFDDILQDDRTIYITQILKGSLPLLMEIDQEGHTAQLQIAVKFLRGINPGGRLLSSY